MTNYSLLFWLSFAIMGAPAFAQDIKAANGGCLTGDTLVVEIDGVRLTRADFERKPPAALFQARNTFYEAERKAVETFVEEYLLERAAQREKVTVAELLDRHVNSAVPPDPPDEALKVYYEGLNTAEPFEAVRQKILEYIRERRTAKVRTAYLQSLRSEAKIAIHLVPPRAQIALRDTPVLGPPDAPVVVVEYADYGCQYCQVIQPQLQKLQQEYKDKVALAYKDMPLPTNPQGQKAAEAAHCAGLQGKFWEYHDLLFATKEHEIPKLKETARALKLNAGAFDRCLDSGEQAAVVKMHLAEAQALGLPGTPAFFINGRFINGAVSYETLRTVIEEELRASSARSQETAKR
jgi:protein-disulfide isomerase